MVLPMKSDTYPLQHPTMPPKIATVAKIGTEAPHWGDFRLSDYDIQGHTQIRHAPDEIDFLENVLLVFATVAKSAFSVELT